MPGGTSQPTSAGRIEGSKAYCSTENAIAKTMADWLAGKSIREDVVADLRPLLEQREVQERSLPEEVKAKVQANTSALWSFRKDLSEGGDGKDWFDTWSRNQTSDLPHCPT